jgi:uncharacterized protein
MFREMRRIGNALPEKEAIAMLQKATNGVLSVTGDDDYPYGVPVSFTYHDNQIIFHCATEGHKLDAIQRNPKVSFCVVEQDLIVPSEFNTLYRSTIAFGHARILSGEEKRVYIEAIAKKYSPDFDKEAKAYIESDWSGFNVVVIDIDHLTGKAGD